MSLPTNKFSVCIHCNQLYVTGKPGICQVDKDKGHTPIANKEFIAVKGDPANVCQSGWKLCSKCNVLWYSGVGSTCADGTPHSTASSVSIGCLYPSVDMSKDTGVWWCHNCSNLVYVTGQPDKSVVVGCAGGGSKHLLNGGVYYNFQAETTSAVPATATEKPVPAAAADTSTDKITTATTVTNSSSTPPTVTTESPGILSAWWFWVVISVVIFILAFGIYWYVVYGGGGASAVAKKKQVL